MAVTTLDTHETVKELLAAGFTDEQAEAVTRVVRRSQDIDLSNLATKNDLQSGLAPVRNDLETGLAAVRTELQSGLAAVRTDLEAGLTLSRTELQSGLAAVRTELHVGLATVRAELQVGLAGAKTDLAEAKAEILKWMVGSIGVQTVVILGAVVALAKTLVH